MTEIFLEKLKFFNIDLLDPAVPNIAKLCVIFFILTLVSLLSFYNFVVYVIVMRVTESDRVLNFIKDKKRLSKLVKYYRNLSTGFIIYDLILFGYCNCSILYLTFSVFNKYYHIV